MYARKEFTCLPVKCIQYKFISCIRHTNVSYCEKVVSMLCSQSSMFLSVLCISNSARSGGNG